jgi:hypothetical protein
MIEWNAEFDGGPMRADNQKIDPFILCPCNRIDSAAQSGFGIRWDTHAEMDGVFSFDRRSLNQLVNVTNPLGQDRRALAFFACAKQKWVTQEVELQAINVVSVERLNNQRHVVIANFWAGIIKTLSCVVAKTFRMRFPEIAMERMIWYMVVMTIIHPEADPRRDSVVAASCDDACWVVNPLLVDGHHSANPLAIQLDVVVWPVGAAARHCRKKGLVVWPRRIITLPKRIPCPALINGALCVGVAEENRHAGASHDIDVSIDHLTGISGRNLLIPEEIEKRLVVK